MNDLKTYTPGLYDATVREMQRKKSVNISKFKSTGANLFLTPDMLDAIDLPLIPFILNGKIGFINNLCNIVVEPKYDEIKGSFRSIQSIVSVRQGNKWTVLNSDGEELLPLTYGTIIPGYDCPLATIQNQSKSKVVNVLTKEIIVDSQYDYIGGFRYGYARVRKNGLWGIINECGALVLPAEYAAIYSFYDFPKATTVLQLSNDSQELFVSLCDLKAIANNEKNFFTVQNDRTDV